MGQLEQNLEQQFAAPKAEPIEKPEFFAPRSRREEYKVEDAFLLFGSIYLSGWLLDAAQLPKSLVLHLKAPHRLELQEVHKFVRKDLQERKLKAAGFIARFRLG